MTFWALTYCSWWNGRGLCEIEVLFRCPITIALAASLCALSGDVAKCLCRQEYEGAHQETKANKFLAQSCFMLGCASHLDGITLSYSSWQMPNLARLWLLLLSRTE